MSSAYSTEPPTQGKVVIHTSKGPLEIELWPKEAPKACRNFIQLSMEGYYDGSHFHRLVKGFILQGGDPTGTGQGGESIYDGKPFDDEFHSRLRFTHRGLLAMANTGPNSNGSQFFFTMDKALELNRQNTIFGKVVGDTIYNLVAMGELETDAQERPLNPPIIQRIDILYNPFDDIIPRENKSRLAKELEKQRVQKEMVSKKALGSNKLKKKHSVNDRNLTLLSFGEEAQEDETDIPVKAKIKSSHDVLVDDPRLKKETVSIEDKGMTMSTTEGESSDEELEQRARKRSQAPSPPPNSKKLRQISPDETSTDSNVRALPSEVRLSSLKNQVANLKSELRSMSSKPSSNSKEEKKAPVSFVEQMRQSYVSSGKVSHGKRAAHTKDSDLMSQLQSFTKLVKSSTTQSPKTSEKVSQPLEEVECDLHFVKGCKSCKDTFGQEDEDSGDEGWMNAELKFAKEVGANVYEAKVDDYTVIDTRISAKDNRKDIFGRNASSGKGTWKDKSLLRKPSKPSLDGYK